MSKWAMECLNGCAVTFYGTEEAALAAAKRHYAGGTHHIPILLWPGSFELSPYAVFIEAPATSANLPPDFIPPASSAIE